MFIKCKNLKIHYKVMGEGPPIILLHGWGHSVNCFSRLQQYLALKFTVYALDLPGFGLSTEPEDVWGSSHYANLIKYFVDNLQIVDPILLGHSFGGKIAINLVAQKLIVAKKLILIGSAGVKLPKSLKVKAKIYFLKLLKLLVGLPIINNIFASRLELYKRKLGSNDYKNAQGIMRAILVKTINEDVKGLLPQIKIPTLLLWGAQDHETPLAAGLIMHKNILNSQLKVFANSGHFPFLDNWDKVKIELDNFLQ